jgi:23S rRNA A1618 N6-methylase RlmF
MASDAALKELFELSKQSAPFKGMSEEDIWNACLSHKDKTDEDIRKAIENIRHKDIEAKEKAQQQQAQLEKGKEKIAALHTQELIDREQDHKNADKILEELFNS